jgi:hypothetical protein
MAVQFHNFQILSYLFIFLSILFEEHFEMLRGVQFGNIWVRQLFLSRITISGTVKPQVDHQAIYCMLLDRFNSDMSASVLNKYHFKTWKHSFKFFHLFENFLPVHAVVATDLLNCHCSLNALVFRPSDDKKIYQFVILKLCILWIKEPCVTI